MTKHGGTFKLSGDTRDLLRKNRDFFDQLTSLNGDEESGKIPLNLLGKDPEAHTEAKIQDNGDVEVAFVYPVDSNPDSSDGRIYLRDTFVFDASEQILKSFDRKAEYNGQGQGNWQAWVEKYNSAIAAAPLAISDEKVQKFAKTIARSFSRPITDETGATLPEIREIWVKDSSYITAANGLILKQRQADDQLPELKLKIKDKLNNFALFPGKDELGNDELDVVFTFAVDNDDDPNNGRILLKDRFTLDPQTMALKKVKRSWELTPEAGDNAAFKSYAEKLPKEDPPSLDSAAAFLKDLLPAVLGDTKGSSGAMSNLVAPIRVPKDFRSAFAKRIMSDKAPLTETPAGTGEALEAMLSVGMEEFAQRQDASLGWYNRNVKGEAPLDLDKQVALIQSLFGKATDYAKKTPTAGAFTALRALKLEGAEAQLRDRLLSDPRMAKIDDIGRESDTDFRAKEFLKFAREDLIKQGGFGASAQIIAQRLVSIDSVKEEAGRVLGIIDGKGEIGAKMEYLVPSFVKQVADPKMLVAMGAAPFLGTAFEFGSLRAFGAFTKLGTGTRMVSSWLGLGGEALAFTSLHRGLQSATHDPAKFSTGFFQEVGATFLLFGAMRGAHALSGRLSRSMAEGKWGSLFGGKASAEGAQVVVSPTGRVLFDQVSTKALTRTGEFFSSAANHFGGISSMYVAGALARRWKLQAESKQSLGGYWFDAAVSYGQATVGFGLANTVSGGKFQSALGEVKLRLSEMGASPASKLEAPASEAKKKERPITLRSKTALSKFIFKSGDTTWPVEVKNVKRIWIGNGISGREGVGYEPDTAYLDIGDKHGDVNQYHAALVRDQSNIFWYVADTGSTYGTYLDGKKLGAGEYLVAKHGSLIQLGDHFQFRMEADGPLLEPDPRVTTTIVNVPMPRVQRRLEPPKEVDVFPFELAFPNKEVPADSNAEVGELRSSHGTVLPLRTGKPVWNLKLPGDQAPSVRIYVDVKGRWVLQKLNAYTKVEMSRAHPDGEKRVILEKPSKDTEGSQPGIGRQDWVFLEPGDKLFLQNQTFDFILHSEPKGNAGAANELVLGAAPVETTPEGGGTSKPSDPPPPPATSTASADGASVGPSPQPQQKSIPRPAQVPGPIAPAIAPPPARAPMPTPLLDAALGAADLSDDPHARPTLVGVNPGELGDADKTKPGIPFPIDIPDQFPQVLLDRIPENQAPFVLMVGDKSVVADRKHTRYLLGSEPETTDKNQVAVVLEGHRIDPNHAEIFLGRMANDGEYQWFLSPHRHNEQGVFIDGYRSLKNDERIPLNPGRIFALGDMVGERGGIKFSFEMPWMRRSSGVPEGVRPASRFPTELLVNLDEKEPPMTLKNNFGANLFRGNRSATRYVLGTGTSNPGQDFSDPVQQKTHRISLTSDKIAPEHCEVFVDAKGQWYLRALSDTHPTYLKGKKLNVGELRFLYNGDSIELGGDEKEGVGLALLFHKPDYAKAERASRPSAPVLPENAEGEFEQVELDDLVDEEPIELGANQVKTVTPPPPDRSQQGQEIPPPRTASGPHVLRSRRGPPPFPAPQVPPPAVTTPASPPAAGEYRELKTGVYTAFQKNALLAQSVEGEPGDPPPTVQHLPVEIPPAAIPPAHEVAVDDPTADWGREFEEGSDTPGSPKAASVPPPVSAAPVADVNEADFGDVQAEVEQVPENLEAPVIPPAPALPRVDLNKTLKVDAPQQVMRPVAPALTDLSEGDGFATVRAEVPRQVPQSGRPSLAELQDLHPELNSPAILPGIEGLLHVDRDSLSAALKALSVFPQLGAVSPKNLLASSTDGTGEIFAFFTKLAGFDVGYESGSTKAKGPYSPQLKDRMLELVGLYYLSGKFKNRYRLESDGTNLKFSAFSEKDGPKPDSVFALSVKHGSEADLLAAVYHHFLTLGVPVEVVVPLQTETMQAPYAGIYFRSENSAELLDAVRALNSSHGPLILENRWIPFSQPVLDSNGSNMPGVGVMEFVQDQNRSNPQEVKKFGVARAFISATKQAKELAKSQARQEGRELGKEEEDRVTPDLRVFLKEILQEFSKLGFDLNNPGFLKGSTEGSHKILAENSDPQQPKP